MRPTSDPFQYPPHMEKAQFCGKLKVAHVVLKALTMSLIVRGLVALSISGVLIACAASSEPTEDADSSSDAITAPTSGAGHLLYEGTCEFLHDCSSYSKKLPAGEVAWGCADVPKTCANDELWVAGPTTSQCGKHVKFCHNGTCAVALVKDVSVSHSWEGSNGLLDAIGLDHTLTGKCSGAGGGSVTIAPTTAAVTAPGDDDDQ